MVSAARAAGDTEKGRERLARTRSRGGRRTPEDVVRDTSRLWAGTWGCSGGGASAEGRSPQARPCVVWFRLEGPEIQW